MKLVVRGETKDYEEGISLTKLIEIEKVETPEYVTASVNDELYGAGDFDHVVLKENDVVEFLYFMGGGCC